jgi:hypothetical protein
MARLLIDDRLASYVRDAARTDFAWGERDCALFVADWVHLVTGRDGAEKLRGRYSCEVDAHVLCGAERLVGTVDRCARLAGLRPTRTPETGDIAVIEALGSAVCAIRGSERWFARLERGLLSTPRGRVVMAWRVEIEGNA